MENAYGPLPAAPDDWFTEERFRNELQNLDTTSSPGWPHMRTAPTIGKWLGADGLGAYDEIRVQTLWYETQQVALGAYDSYFRVFIKDEPHKMKKVLASKWRLIIAASLPVQMFWRLLFKHQNDWLNDRPYTTPSAHGLKFCHGGWRRFKAMLSTEGLCWSRDISAWDVNAPGWVMRCVREFRKRQGGPASWLRAVDVAYDDAFVHPKLVFSNGTVLLQEYEGFQKSGLFNTISDNSLAMIPPHVIASYRAHMPVGKIKATGDDVLQSNVTPLYLEKLQELGLVVKECERAAVFMGTDFTDRPKPVYIGKHIVNVASTNATLEDVLDSYKRLYCFSEYYELWERVTHLLGLRTRSRAFCEFWYSSPLARLFYGDSMFD